MARATRSSMAGTRRSASAVPVSSPVQSSPKRRRKTIPSPPPENSEDEDSDSSVVTTVTTKSTSTVSSRAPRRAPAKSRASTTTRQVTRRTTRTTLSSAEVQETSVATTSRTSRNKLTPAPTESARSVTPGIGTIDPATPVKPEPKPANDSPKESSDKENQVPSLQVPNLLGSVKKGQQLTPPPEYVSPRKLDVARLTAMDAHPVEEGPRNRIVITHLVLNNFKSYAGRQVIGPFHTSFSSIVGPNGSGKSNVIDSLLFVFGFRASKMRQGKISALIHNSAAHPNLDSCSVEVHFEEITDLPGGGTENVPNSTIVVSRKAFKNNASQYSINGRNSNYTEVTTMLREKGIDLDHKRFLILQGEVESIAQMKPKAQNEHDDGLLEYLEDIIGTAKYKQPIEDAAKEVEALNEVCLEKSNRVALVEKEKDSLEDKKATALEYVKDENQLIKKQSALYQLYIAECGNNINITEQVINTMQKQLDEELAKHKGNEDEIKKLEKLHKKGTDELHSLEKANAEVSKELAKFDREDVQLQEKKKHKLAKQKKLQKTVQTSKHSHTEATTWITNHTEEIEKHTKKLVELESSLAVEEKELDTIRDGLKVKTQGFTDQIEKKQKSLEPWTAKINEKQAAIALTQSELDLIREKESQSVKAVEEAQAKLQSLATGKTSKESEIKQSQKEFSSIEKQSQDLAAQLKHCQQKGAKLYEALSQSRSKADEAKASLSASQTQGQVLSSLTRLRDSGRIQGFHGRLGNLGTIDAKYDVAISTACPQLDNMVVDTVEAGQQCIEYLRKNNVGRANFIVLDRLPQRDLSPINTPESAPRLFDLVKPKDAKFAAAFYSVLSDTIVAKDLTQANRVAYGVKRWRVVTLEGGLIDKSGTMTGGGTKVSRGGMSDKLVADMSKEGVAKLEKDRDVLEAEYSQFRAEQTELETKIAALEKRGPELEMQQSKLSLEISAIGKSVEDAQKQLSELKSQSVNAGSDKKQIANLESKISKLKAEVDKLHAETAGIENEIKALQEKIMEVGGVKLRSQKAKVDDLRDQITALNDRITTCDVARVKNQKDCEKFAKLIASSEEELETLTEELAAIDEDMKQSSRNAEQIRKKAQETEHVFSVKQDELKELKESLDERRAALNTTRGEEIEMRNRLEEHQKVLVDNQKRGRHWTEKLRNLALNEMSSMLGDKEQELVEYSEDELAEMDKDSLKGQIAILEEKLQTVKVDFSALEEYQRRETEYKERSKDLEQTTTTRDSAKKLCDDLRKRRLEEFMNGFNIISLRLKEMYQMITMGGNAELELVDSLDPFSEGILFSVMPPKKSWKNISNLSGGEKTLSSLALVFALHHYKPTPLYVMDEIDAALDFRNVSIVANYIKERTKNAQFIVISLRNNMFELAARLVGIYKTSNMTKSITIDNKDYIGMSPQKA